MRPYFDDGGGELLHFSQTILLLSRRKSEDSCFQMSDALPEFA
jgi:hypothetical protein